VEKIIILGISRAVRTSIIFHRDFLDINIDNIDSNSGALLYHLQAIIASPSA